MSIIVPAHNEAGIISACISRLIPLAQEGVAQLIVVCNGCTDDTAERARKFDLVEVVEIQEASKTAALNAGDLAAQHWPRIYLDADTEASPAALVSLAEAFDDPSVLAARPRYGFRLRNAGWLLRSYYRARIRTRFYSESLWGSGIYALSESGHRRLGAFPKVVADDLLIDALFASTEKKVVAASLVEVSVPVTIAATVRVGRRIRRGNAESGLANTQTGTLRDVVWSSRSARDVADAAVYVAVAMFIRVSGLIRAPQRWERDDRSASL